MANYISTGAAGGALRGGMLGGLIGFFTIPAIAAGAVALSAIAIPGFGAALGIAATAGGIAAAAGLTGLATTILGALPITPFNWVMAAYGAAGGGLFGAAGGAEHGIRENIEAQARSAYINGYAQTRAGIAQMQEAAYMQEMQAANQNFPMAKADSVVSAASVTPDGKGVKSAELAMTNEQGRA